MVASGSPSEVITPTTVEDVFDVLCRVIEDPEPHTPLIRR